MVPAIFAGIALFLGMAAPISALPVLFKALGLDPIPYTALVVASNAVVVIFFGLFLGKFKLPLAVRTVGAGTLIALGLGVQPLITGPVGAILATALWSIGEVLVIAEIAAAFFERSNPEYLGLAAGLKIFSMRFGYFLCPLFVWFFRPTTVTQFILIWGLPTFSAGWVLYLALKRPRSTPSPEFSRS
ncbi:hypothetical protein WDW37_04690 [Bdellovibrionota bacterium FG-1]